ncbi:MAG: phosphoglycolate phosphatase [Pseudomonadota bacterium]
MKALVFDLDGTLIHSAPDIHAAANRMLDALDRPTLTLEQVISFIGAGVPKLVERALTATGGADEAATEDALGRFNAFYQADPSTLTRPYPGVEPLLSALAAAGVPLGICTNKPQAFTETILDDLKLRSRFTSVVGGDRLGVRKPDPAPLRLCFEELSVAPKDGLYIGDSETDEATAQALGAPFAFFSGGYRKKAPEAFEARLRFDDFASLRRELAPLLGDLRAD